MATSTFDCESGWAYDTVESVSDIIIHCVHSHCVYATWSFHQLVPLRSGDQIGAVYNRSTDFLLCGGKCLLVTAPSTYCQRFEHSVRDTDSLSHVDRISKGDDVVTDLDCVVWSNFSSL